jgi:hypothetical protein
MHEVSGALHLFHSFGVLDRLLLFRFHICYQPYGSCSASDLHAVFKTPRADLILVVNRMAIALLLIYTRSLLHLMYFISLVYAFPV